MTILLLNYFFYNVHASEIFLYLFFNAIILNSIISFFVKNPIYSLLFLIVNYIVAGFIFMLNNFIFFSLVFILIYVGAVSILLLFTFMLLNIKIIYYNNFSKNYFFYFFYFFVLIEIMVFIVIKSKINNLLYEELTYFFDWFTIYNLENDLNIIAFDLYLKHSPVVLFSSFLILMSLIASVNVVSSLKTSKKQDAFLQLKKYTKNFLS